MKPEPGQVYRSHGYVFRVDMVDDEAVYVLRWKEGEKPASGRRDSVTFQIWENEMADAECV